MVYLTGKVDQGKTIYIEEDGTAHRHKAGEERHIRRQQPTTDSTTTTISAVNANSGVRCGTTNITESSPAIKVINAKLDRIINLLVE